MAQSEDNVGEDAGMTHFKKYDVLYPGVTDGIKALEISPDMRTLAELITQAGGSPATIRVFRPASITYDYVTVPRD